MAKKINLKTLDLSGTSLQARGTRVWAIRKMIFNTSRSGLKLRHGISASTQQNWEEARSGGLSEIGAKRVIAALAAEGIPCSLEWLFYGVGDPPPGLDLPILPQPGTSLENAYISKELQLFHKHYPNGVDAIVADDAMLPLLTIGDVVAGNRYFEKDIAKALGRPAIVQLASGEVLIRSVEQSNKEGLYYLSCMNMSTTAAKPAPNNVKLFSVAPILWIRKKESP